MVGLARRVTFVGLAKNTGKTEALATLVREQSDLGLRLAITSIGRDGEASDAIQPRITKPPILCPAQTLVATTHPLLRRCGAAHEVLVQTGFRTPLGSVVIGRLRESAQVEVAGPSSSAQVRTVVDEMLSLGADQAIIDGSIDRRAATAPLVSDAVVMATGAVLGREIEEVVLRTGHALEVAGLPRAVDPWLRELFRRARGRALAAVGGEIIPLPARFALTAETRDLPAPLREEDGRERALVIGGVLPERFLEALLPGGTAHRTKVVVANPTKVFIRSRSPRWYRRTGIDLEVLNRTDLAAITVNPLAPLSHRLDSASLRTAVAKLAPTVPVVDVKSPGYGATLKLAS